MYFSFAGKQTRIVLPTIHSQHATLYRVRIAFKHQVKLQNCTTANISATSQADFKSLFLPGEPVTEASLVRILAASNLLFSIPEGVELILLNCRVL